MKKHLSIAKRNEKKKNKKVLSEIYIKKKRNEK